MEDDKKKKTKEERQAERQAQREERQARREEHKEYVKENGTAIGNELRALGQGLKADWQNDMNAIKGRRNGDPAAKTTEETPEAPAPATAQTQTTEAPAQTQTPATTQTQTTEAPAPVAPATTSVEPTDVTPTENTEVSPAPTTEETAVEKTDGTDVDGATGVASQEAGDGAVIQPTPTDYNYTAYGKNAPVFNDNGNDDNGIEVSRGSRQAELGNTATNTTTTTVTNEEIPEEVVTGQDNQDNQDGQDNQNGNAGAQGQSQGSSSSITTPRGWEAPYEKYNPDEDPNVQAIRKSNEAVAEAYLGKILKDKDGNPLTDENGDVMRDDSGKLAKFDAMLEDFKKYDEERTRRDAANAFWRGVGEAGGALVNFLGVSGAFGGKNAYDRGAYSSMQKFDLTTDKLTDKMKADMEKRKERMDALREKQKELGLQWAALNAKGIEAEGKATHEGAKEVAERNLKLNQLREARSSSEWTRVGADGSITSGGNGSGKWTKDNAPVTFTIGRGKNGQGKQGEFTIQKGILDEALKDTSGNLADAIARELGFINYNEFARTKDALGRNGDILGTVRGRVNEVNNGGGSLDANDRVLQAGINALADYELAREMSTTIGTDRDYTTALKDWAFANGEYYPEYGRYLQHYLRGILGEDDSGYDGGDSGGGDSGGSTGSGGGTGNGGNNGGNNGNGGNFPPGVERIG